jgi:hypothetical protein
LKKLALRVPLCAFEVYILLHIPFLLSGHLVKASPITPAAFITGAFITGLDISRPSC